MTVKKKDGGDLIVSEGDIWAQRRVVTLCS